MSYLIVGLGNPGKEYSASRHNLGFLAADKLASRLGAATTKTAALAKAWSAEKEGKRIFILKPETFMNLSGVAVASFMRTKKIPVGGLIVAHDDLDLPFGEIRVSRNSSSGGHNGVRSVIESVGSKDFARVRIGIGRPPENVPADKYVLERFTSEERSALPGIIDKAIAETEKIFSI
jgi:peptidyl-tRNA hydrolase, PTH1 family